MLDKLIIGVAALIAGFLIADTISVVVTNKRLHEILLEKFRAFAEGIEQWCKEHEQEIKNAKIFLRLCADEAVVTVTRAGRKLAAFAQKSDQTVKIISHEVILTDEEIKALGFNSASTSEQTMEYMQTN